MIQIRPLSSKVIATGLTMSGSAATTSTGNPGGTVIVRAASPPSADGWAPGPGRAGSSPRCRAGFARTADRVDKTDAELDGHRESTSDQGRTRPWLFHARSVQASPVLWICRARPLVIRSALYDQRSTTLVIRSCSTERPGLSAQRMPPE